MVHEYLKALRSELERLKPCWGATSHGVVLGNDGWLVLLLVCGDVVLPYPFRPADLDHEDPVEAAQILWPKVDKALDDPDYGMITYKT